MQKKAFLIYLGLFVVFFICCFAVSSASGQSTTGSWANQFDTTGKKKSSTTGKDEEKDKKDKTPPAGAITQSDADALAAVYDSFWLLVCSPCVFCKHSVCFLCPSFLSFFSSFLSFPSFSQSFCPPYSQVEWVKRETHVILDLLSSSHHHLLLLYLRHANRFPYARSWRRASKEYKSHSSKGKNFSLSSSSSSYLLSFLVVQNTVDSCFSALTFWAWGFAIAFGKGNGFIGMSNVFLLDYTRYEYFFYQYTFCNAATTIVSGAVAERVRFEAYMVTATFLSGWIYPIVAHCKSLVLVTHTLSPS
jgi:hypothetical protein